MVPGGASLERNPCRGPWSPRSATSARENKHGKNTFYLFILWWALSNLLWAIFKWDSEIVSTKMWSRYLTLLHCIKFSSSQENRIHTQRHLYIYNPPKWTILSEAVGCFKCQEQVMFITRSKSWKCLYLKLLQGTFISCWFWQPVWTKGDNGDKRWVYFVLVLHHQTAEQLLPQAVRLLNSPQALHNKKYFNDLSNTDIGIKYIEMARPLTGSHMLM